MSFIEGIGDEVILFFVIVLVFALATLITLVGSVPRISATLITRYEQNSFEQREDLQSQNSEPPSGIPDVRLWHNGLLLRTNSFTRIEADDHLASTRLRTEADGSSVGDTGQDLRTEADGSAELSAQNVDNDQPEGGGLLENSEEREGPVEGEFCVRLKYLNDTERTVTTHPCTKIGDFKRKHFRDAIGENKTVRLIFAGRLLQDHSTVESCRIVENSVVHVQVLQEQRQQSNQQPVSQDTDLDLGRLLVPALTVLLGICWVLYSKYPEFFSTVSLVVLGTLSCFFLAYVVQSHR